MDILAVPDTNATTACQIEEKIAEKTSEKDETGQKIDDVFGCETVRTN